MTTDWPDWPIIVQPLFLSIWILHCTTGDYWYHTGENGFVCVEFPAADAQYDVAEWATLEQRSKVVAKSTLGDFDRRTAWLAGNVHSLSDDTYLPTTSATLTLSLPIPLRLYTLPYCSNKSFLIFDIRALWRSDLSAQMSKIKNGQERIWNAATMMIKTTQVNKISTKNKRQWHSSVGHKCRPANIAKYEIVRFGSKNSKK